MTTTTQDLPASTPSAQGIDARGILAFLDAIENGGDVDPHGLMVLRRGRLVAAGWWAPYSPDRLHLLYSLSKSFTSTAAGLAVAEGLISLDDPVIDHFPEFADEITDPRSRAMRVRHVASMSSGHTYDTWDDAVAGDPVEPVRGFLLLPPERDPGTVFAYNQSATYTLATIIQRASGQTLSEYLRPRLFDPLGIGEVGWQQYPPGRDLGFSGLHATTDAIARLGQLYLQRGAWHGRQLLSEQWVAEATRTQVANPAEPNPDWQQGYGFQFWMARHGYRGDGAYGQFCIVLPEQDMVIAMTAATLGMQAVLDAVWRHLLPAVGAATDSGADAELHRRLATLALPAAPGRAPADPAAWTGIGFTPVGGTCRQQPSLTRVDVRQDGEGWQITLQDGDSALAMRLGIGDWVISEPAVAAGDSVPVAVSGGWRDPQTLRIEIRFLETPHRLVLTCTLDARTFRALWTRVPLHTGTLSELRVPRAQPS